MAKSPADRWTITGVLVAVIGVGVAIYFGINSSKSATGTTPSTSPSKTSPSTPTTPASGKTPAATPVWTSSNPVLIGTAGVDFDSIPPVANNGTNTLILFEGKELYTNGSIRIATWTKNIQPMRDECNLLTQTQGDSQQPAATGEKYCLLTGQGHTVYLKITNIDASDQLDIRAYADVIVWNTTG